MTKPRSKARAAARLAAVQALYQLEMEEHRARPPARRIPPAPARRAKSRTISTPRPKSRSSTISCAASIARRDEIDALLSGKLAEGWKLERLDKTMLQILRAGT